MGFNFPTSIVILDEKGQKVKYFNHTFEFEFKVFNPEQAMDVVKNIEIGTIFEAGSIVRSGELREERVPLIKCLEKNADIWVSKHRSNMSTSGFYKDGRHFNVFVKKMIWDQTTSLVLMLLDVSEKDRVRALNLSDKQKDKLLATLSHELRTPLNGI